MQRLTALVLGLAVLVTTAGAVAPLHVHFYTDHDHPEHRHGPASHEHSGRAPRSGDAAARLQPCHPGEHASTLVLGSAVVPHLEGSVAAEVASTTSVPPTGARGAQEITEVRVHGPPLRGPAPSRAPPAFLPA